MLSALQIKSFRAFRSFTIDKLARVNLLVGRNNSGKTCVLDAAEVLQSGGDPRVIWQSAQRRGELIAADGEQGEESADLSHLFHGHELYSEDDEIVGASFSVSDPGGVSSVSCEIVPGGGTQRLWTKRGSVRHTPSWDLRIRSDRFGEITLHLEEGSDGLSGSEIGAAPKAIDLSVHYISTGEQEGTLLGELWDDLLLTPEEGQVVEALRIVEPRIERIAFTRPSGRRGAFFVKLAGSDQRLPLGSMGDGLKRLLALSLHLARSTGGCLLVDEIDTGLHYLIMVQMWRLVIETARRLDVQVLATTHSIDCINALAEVCERAPERKEDVLLHRIERGEAAAVTYTADELRVAAAQHMEVR